MKISSEKCVCHTEIGEEKNLVIGRLGTEVFDEAVRYFAEQAPGEPFYLLNESALRERVRLMRDRFIGELVYCVKANSDENVLDLVMDEGVTTFDCASREEAELVLALMPDARVLMNNPKRSWTRFVDEIGLGANHWTVDTRSQLEMVLGGWLLQSSGQKNLEVAVRIATSNESALQNLSAKFGATQLDGRVMIQELRGIADVKAGLSIHIGSQNSNTESFVIAIKGLLSLAREVGGVDFINLGGGPPVNYYPEHDYGIDGYIDATNQALADGGVDDGVFTGEPKIYFEPGRSVVAESVDLIVPGWDLKENGAVKHLYLAESVYGAFAAAAVHGWRFRIEPHALDGRPFSLEKEKYVVWGRTCDSGDQLIGTYDLPRGISVEDVMGKFENGEVNPGRVIFRVPTAGAYMRCCGSNFNGFGNPRYGHFSCNS